MHGLVWLKFSILVKFVSFYFFLLLFCCCILSIYNCVNLLYIVGANAVGGSRYGYSPAGIALENVTCEGFESSLGGCSYSPLGRIVSPQCRRAFRNAAGVECIIQQGNNIIIIFLIKN